MIEQKNGDSVAVAYDPEACQHHWVIQLADGPYSIGTCHSCGGSKQFKNFVENGRWGDERPRADAPVSLLGRPSRIPALIEEDLDS